MKAFWIKVIDLAVICLILFMYQTSAKSKEGLKAQISAMREQLVQEGTVASDDEEDDFRTHLTSEAVTNS
jgi:hypothetical protein